MVRDAVPSEPLSAEKSLIFAKTPSGDLASIHRTYVSDIERGARNPTITIVQRLGDALGADTADLLL